MIPSRVIMDRCMMKVIVYLLAAVGLVTGILQLCPVNALLKINTAGIKKS